MGQTHAAGLTMPKCGQSHRPNFFAGTDEIVCAFLTITKLQFLVHIRSSSISAGVDFLATNDTYMDATFWI